MTEKEKATKGMLYNANYDEELLTDGKKSQAILFEYNHTHPNQEEIRQNILEKLLGKIGQNLIIRPPFFCDYGYNIEIGNNFFANINFVVLDGAKVNIGDNVFVAPNVGIYTAGHPFEVELRNEGLEYAYPITIGNNVWIGAGVQILPGVTIGDNTVIGAGSIVNKSIPSNVLAVGNPCKVIRQITNGEKKKI